MTEFSTDNLNKDQQKAILETEGYIRIIAGPGSGKTKVLTERYIHITENLSVSTSNILCVTFTNKAANEMKRRIKSRIYDGDLSYVSTFHSFCVTILREDITYANWTKNFQILDNSDKDSLIKNVLEDCNYKLTDVSLNKAKKYIETKKATDPEYIEYLINAKSEKLIQEYKSENNLFEKIYLGFLYEQKKAQALDFDDLMNFVLYIFKNNEKILEKWQKKLQYIMVDEFQDVSIKQYYFVKLLSAYHKNLFVVGDPDQTIYSFRGANPDIILNFDKDFENTKTFFLNTNYRSTPEILNVANSLISKNKNRIQKTLTPVKNTKEKAFYKRLKNDKEQGEWIAKQIKNMKNKGTSYNNFAVLYRSNRISRIVEEGLIKNEIPYIIYGGINFYERKEIKDAISYLKTACNFDDLSFLRIINTPKRNIGKKRIEFLKEYANSNEVSLYQALVENVEAKLFKETGASDFIKLINKYSSIYKQIKPSVFLENILSESGYEDMIKSEGDSDRLDNIAELKQALCGYEQDAGEKYSIEEFLQKIALMTNMDRNEEKERVKLMTVHSSKGLEFPYVFVCALSENIFPSKNVTTRRELEEERRLAFVAFTRAENLLILTDAEGYSYEGDIRYPSRFIFNIDKELLNYDTKLEKAFEEEAARYIRAQEANLLEDILTIKKEAKVRHKFFGEGIIKGYDERKQEYTIKFDNLETERNISAKGPIEII